MGQGVKITDHGLGRSKERAGLKKKSLDRMLEKVLKDGRVASDFSGRFRRYLDGQHIRYPGKGKNIMVYGEFIYIFRDGHFVTMWGIPAELRKYVRPKGEKRHAV